MPDARAVKPLTSTEIAQVLLAINAAADDPVMRELALQATIDSFRGWCAPADVDLACSTLAVTHLH